MATYFSIVWSVCHFSGAVCLFCRSRCHLAGLDVGFSDTLYQMGDPQRRGNLEVKLSVMQLPIAAVTWLIETRSCVDSDSTFYQITLVLVVIIVICLIIVAHISFAIICCVNDTMGDFTFWLRLSLSLNFGLSTYLSQKVKWFRWAKTWRLTWIV